MKNIITTEQWANLKKDAEVLYSFKNNKGTFGISSRSLNLTLFQTVKREQDNLIILVLTSFDGYARSNAEETEPPNSYLLTKVFLLDLKHKNNKVFFENILMKYTFSFDDDMAKELKFITNYMPYAISPFSIERNKLTVTLYTRPFTEENKVEFINGEAQTINKEENYEH